MSALTLQLGVKTDPVEYRYSYEWLFRLLAEEGVHYVQLGTFFEIYQLPDEFFQRLRRKAEDLGIEVCSIFTAHRELGGFFIDEPGWEAVARRNYERLIEVGSLVGAKSVGSNPGAVYRDRTGTKKWGVKGYLGHMKELMQFARERRIEWLTIEPMSCLAEPPTLPEEISQMADELAAWHQQNPETTTRVGFCTDIAHGYADADGRICHGHLELLEATLPHLYELHLKNCDVQYSSTFGFGPVERQRGIVQIEPVRQILLDNAAAIPVDRLVGYLEIGGPKLGRDYSDKNLADLLRESLAYLKEAWPTAAAKVETIVRPLTPDPSPVRGEGSTRGEFPTRGERSIEGESPARGEERFEPASRHERPVRVRPVRVSPSIMCADLCHLEASLRQLEAAGADMLHIDMADGHFVPNLLLGLDIVRQLRPKTRLPLDVHLMVENPDQYLEPLAEIGVEYVAVHAEACRHLDRTLSRIRELGMKAGVALNPATPLEAIEYVLERLDFVLLMTVNPGFAGQKLVASAIRKIADCRRWLSERSAEVAIMVDGNVSFAHIPNMVDAGADILVAGTSSWFHGDGSLMENVTKTDQAIRAGLDIRKG